MTSFRSIGRRAEFQGGVSFSNVVLTNQISTSRYPLDTIDGPTGPLTSLSVMRDQLKLIAQDPTVLENIRDAAYYTLGTSLASNTIFLINLADAASPIMVTNLSNLTFIQSLSNLTHLRVKTLLSNNVSFKESLAAFIDPVYKSRLLTDAEFLDTIRIKLGFEIISNSIRSPNPTSSVMLYQTINGTINFGGSGSTHLILGSLINVGTNVDSVILLGSSSSSVTAPTLPIEDNSTAVATTSFVTLKVLSQHISLTSVQTISELKTFKNSIFSNSFVHSNYLQNVSVFANLGAGFTIFTGILNITRINGASVNLGTTSKSIGINGTVLFNGSVTVPTPPSGSNDGTVATTSFVNSAVSRSNLLKKSYEGYTLINGFKQFFGAVLAPTQTEFTGTRAATTLFVKERIDLLCIKLYESQVITVSKTFSGSLLSPTAELGDASAAAATTSFVVTELNHKLAKWDIKNENSEMIGGNKTFTGEIISNIFGVLTDLPFYHLFLSNTGTISVGGGSLTTANTVRALYNLPVDLYKTHTGTIKLGEGNNILVTPNTVRSVNSNSTLTLFESGYIIRLGSSSSNIIFKATELTLPRLVRQQSIYDQNFFRTTTGQINIGGTGSIQLPSNISSHVVGDTLNLFTSQTGQINLGSIGTLKTSNTVIQYDLNSSVKLYETQTAQIKIGSATSTTNIKGTLKIAANKKITFSSKTSEISYDSQILGSEYSLAIFGGTAISNVEATSTVVVSTYFSLPIGLYLLTGSVIINSTPTTPNTISYLIVTVGTAANKSLFGAFYTGFGSTVTRLSRLFSVPVNLVISIETPANLNIYAYGTGTSGSLECFNYGKLITLVRLA